MFEGSKANCFLGFFDWRKKRRNIIKNLGFAEKVANDFEEEEDEVEAGDSSKDMILFGFCFENLNMVFGLHI